MKPGQPQLRGLAVAFFQLLGRARSEVVGGRAGARARASFHGPIVDGGMHVLHVGHAAVKNAGDDSDNSERDNYTLQEWRTATRNGTRTEGGSTRSRQPHLISFRWRVLQTRRRRRSFRGEDVEATTTTATSRRDAEHLYREARARCAGTRPRIIQSSPSTS